MKAVECDAIITANAFRAGLPGIVPANRPWITWVTKGPHCILPPDDAAPLDRVMLADPEWTPAARRLGWREDQIEIAAWPDRLGLFAGSASPSGKSLGLLADVRSIEMPDQLKEVSSHRLLWESIADELANDPPVLGIDPRKYLENRMAKMGVTAERFDFGLFFERLIMPAYWAGLTDAALKAGLPVSIIGRDCTGTPGDLVERILDCGAMIHPMPGERCTSGRCAGNPGDSAGGTKFESVHFRGQTWRWRARRRFGAGQFRRFRLGAF